MSCQIEFSNPGLEKQLEIPPCRFDEYEEVAWGVEKFGKQITRFTINRPKVGPYDIKIDLKYCGICHTDIHQVINDLGNAVYPAVPGHEMAGIVSEVGGDVTRFKVGDRAAVGYMVDSCLACDNCEAGEENYCNNGAVFTAGAPKKYDHIGGNRDVPTFGGYSASHVVHERFGFRLPDKMPLEKAGSLLCAGVTMWDPLRHWGATTGKKMSIGIVGIGGVGTMGIKLASALGHRVVAISSSERKRELAQSKGAEGYVVSTNPDSLATETGKLNLILNTVPGNHPVDQYLSLLKAGGVLVQVGIGLEPLQAPRLQLVMRRMAIAGSFIGGSTSTEEMLQFCDKHEVYPDIKIVDSSELTGVFCKLQKSNADSLRYVLDITKSLEL